MRAYDIQKAVKIELDKERTLYFNIGAIQELEGLLGGNVMALASDEKFASSLSFLFSALYTGLKTDDKSLTRAAVADIVEEILENSSEDDVFGKTYQNMLQKTMAALMNSGLFGRKKVLFPEEEPETIAIEAAEGKRQGQATRK